MVAMRFKNNTLVLALVSVMSIGLIPSSVSAIDYGTVVSQTFTTPAAYFTTNSKTDYVVSDTVVYASTTSPSSAQIWQDTGVRASSLNDFSEYSFTSESVAYGDYSYIGIDADIIEYNADGMTAEFTDAIWRVGSENGTVVMESVYEHTSDSYANRFVELFTYKKALYALRANGELWKTKNGTKWFKVHSKTLPKYNGITDYHVAVSHDTIYLGLEGWNLETPEIYTSRKGKTWKLLEGNYQDAASDASTSDVEIIGINDLAVFEDEYDLMVYATIINQYTDVTSIWTYGDDVETWTQNKAEVGDGISFVEIVGKYEDLVYYGSSSINSCRQSVTGCVETRYPWDEIRYVIPGTSKLVAWVHSDDGYYLIRE